jgi:hypothetical protein
MAFLFAGAAVTQNSAGDTTFVLNGGSAFNDTVTTLVDSEGPSKSILAILYLPPALLLLATIVAYFEYKIQSWTPPGHIIDLKWTPYIHPEAWSIKQRYHDAEAAWKKDHPNESDTPTAFYQDYLAEKRQFRDRHAAI